MKIIFNFTEEIPKLITEKNTKDVTSLEKIVGKFITLEHHKLLYRIYGFNILSKTKYSWYYCPKNSPITFYELKHPITTFQSIIDTLAFKRPMWNKGEDKEIFKILKKIIHEHI